MLGLITIASKSRHHSDNSLGVADFLIAADPAAHHHAANPGDATLDSCWPATEVLSAEPRGPLPHQDWLNSSRPLTATEGRWAGGFDVIDCWALFLDAETSDAVMRPAGDLYAACLSNSLLAFANPSSTLISGCCRRIVILQRTEQHVYQNCRNRTLQRTLKRTRPASPP